MQKSTLIRLVDAFADTNNNNNSSNVDIGEDNDESLDRLMSATFDNDAYIARVDAAEDVVEIDKFKLNLSFPPFLKILCSQDSDPARTNANAMREFEDDIDDSQTTSTQSTATKANWLVDSISPVKQRIVFQSLLKKIEKNW